MAAARMTITATVSTTGTRRGAQRARRGLAAVLSAVAAPHR
jgi:hypothetical protein